MNIQFGPLRVVSRNGAAGSTAITRYQERRRIEPACIPAHRAVWIATVVSGIGTWMQDIGNARLMTSLSASPLRVSLVRAATSLPMFLLALPAGALADVVDRRRLLLFTQLWMSVATLTLGVLTLGGLTTANLLFCFAFLIGAGSAMNSPAYQAVVPELIPREELQRAVSLNSMGINLARAIGPAIGGFLIAAAGPGITFVVNGLCFIGVMVVVLFRWKRKPVASTLPAESLVKPFARKTLSLRTSFASPARRVCKDYRVHARCERPLGTLAAGRSKRTRPWTCGLWLATNLHGRRRFRDRLRTTRHPKTLVCRHGPLRLDDRFCACCCERRRNSTTDSPGSGPCARGCIVGKWPIYA